MEQKRASGGCETLTLGENGGYRWEVPVCKCVIELQADMNITI